MMDTNHLNIILLGADVLAGELSSQINSQCPNREFEHGGQVFSLDLRTISGDVDKPQNNFKTADFSPQGCFCVYSDVASFEYIRSSLEKTLLSNLEKDDGLPFQGLPLVILFQPETKLSEKDSLRLREEGQNLADSLQCPFLDEDWDEIKEGAVIEDSLRALVESIKHRSSGILSIAPPLGDTSGPPDLRVIMCLHCGDPFNIEAVLGPLLGHSSCHQSGERSVCVEQQIDDKTKKVEVILSSYHSAIEFREELVHGFILVYSSRRKASIATLSAFSMNIPELPIQIVAVTESASKVNVNMQHASELSQMLVAEGSNLSDQLSAHFVTSEVNQKKSNFYNSFFREVCDKKAEIEKAFSMDEHLSGRLDDSGEGTLERPPRRNPVPPPRMDSYHIRGPSSLNSRSGSGRSGSGSEIFDRLPDSGLHCGDDGSGSEDSDVYSQLDSLDRHKLAPGARRPNGDMARIKTGHQRRRGKVGGAPPPDCSPPPPPRPKFHPGRVMSGQSDSPKSGTSVRSSSGAYTRALTQQSTFGKAATMYKAESLSLEAMRGGSNHSSFFPDQGWMDDSSISRRDEDERLSSKYNQGTFTTGRTRSTKKHETFSQRSQESVLPPAPGPGKLNMADYHHVSSALSRLSMKTGRSAPLADGEDCGEAGDYAVPQDVINNGAPGSEYAQPMLQEHQAHRPKPRSKNRERRERAKIDYSDSETDTSSDERDRQTHKKPGASRKTRKKRSAIPVATPVVPNIPATNMAPVKLPEAVPLEKRSVSVYSDSDDSDSFAGDEMFTRSHHHQSRQRGQHPRQLGLHHPHPQFMFPPPPPGPPPPDSELYITSHIDESPKQMMPPMNLEENIITTEKQKKKLEKELKSKQKEIAKQEKKEKEREERENKAKVKEEKKKEKLEKKNAARSNMKANSVQGQPCMEDFRASDDDPIPLFLSRCIEFIETEGVATEGLYRVPGNRAHVDLIFQKFDEDPHFNIHALDIAVNAAATAVKDFFFKRLPPLLPQEHMTDLEQIAVMSDRHMRLLEIKKLLERLPRANHAVLKFLFQHFVKVSERSKINCMDSKNLAICWWPTLLQYEFGDLDKFETMRPHLEDVVQTFIDQYRFLFCGLEEVMMV